MEFDIAELIKAAKLGRTRKDAQVDTCAVFAAALYDFLKARGIPRQMFTASGDTWGGWHHAVVKVGSRYYDSMGEFSEAIFRARSKIHPKVTFTVTFRRDTRADCYEAEFDEMYAFYLAMLTKAAEKAAAPVMDAI